MCTVQPGTERLITPLPMVHMNAMACSTMAMILAGGCIVPLDRFHPGTWWRSVRESRATIVHYLGVMPSMLMGAEPSRADREHHVRFGFGAGVDKRLHAPFEARFGFPLLEAWAMTETGMGAVIIANREPRHVGTACFGRPEPDVEARVVDDHGNDVAADMPGELLVRAAGSNPRRGFFREYLKDPEATAEAWAGGWFHTGDVVTRDAAGYFHFVDRKKNVIRRSGENIAAVEVESVLRQHPLVRQVAVAATPDPLRGDEVLACVIPAQPIPPDGCGRGRCRHHRVLPAAARLLQSAGLCRLRRQPAAHGHPEGAARRAEGAGARAAGHAGVHRHPASEATSRLLCAYPMNRKGAEAQRRLSSGSIRHVANGTGRPHERGHAVSRVVVLLLLRGSSAPLRLCGSRVSGLACRR